jgi:hypothetical protein
MNRLNYSIPGNLASWAFAYLMVGFVQMAATFTEDPMAIWASGIGLGFLIMWAFEIFREWLMSKRK